MLYDVSKVLFPPSYHVVSFSDKQLFCELSNSQGISQQFNKLVPKVLQFSQYSYVAVAPTFEDKQNPKESQIRQKTIPKVFG